MKKSSNTNANKTNETTFLLEATGPYQFFQASYAKISFSDGVVHEFIPTSSPTAAYYDNYLSGHGPDEEGDNETRIATATTDPSHYSSIEFFTMPIGDALQFSYNASQCQKVDYIIQRSCRWPHSVHIIMEPHSEWSERMYSWRLTQAWVTPGWQWEWVLWTSVGLVEVPHPYNTLQCDELNVQIGGSSPSSFDTLVIRNFTLGVGLPTNFSPEHDLSVYRPCGSRHKCKILNNEIYCRNLIRGFPTWDQLIFFGLILFTLSIFVCCCSAMMLRCYSGLRKASANSTMTTTSRHGSAQRTCFQHETVGEEEEEDRLIT